ncbi:thioredoxin-like protein [Xylariales sp. PMI_506]|nr:thioredoxin-like protein [Xylariales sp. PMI_506]
MGSLPTNQPVATGEAAKVVAAHQKPADIVLWGAWFCPFTQRSWIVLEEKGVPYTYRETNPYLKEPSFLEISPQGSTPGLRAYGKPLFDSTLINEYLEDALADNPGVPALLPRDPYERARGRQWIEYINKSVVPSFLRLLLLAKGQKKRVQARRELAGTLETVSKQWRGPYFFGSEFSLVDAAIAPWAVRDWISREYPAFHAGEAVGPAEWAEWAEALRQRPSVARTTSTYLHKD